MKNLNILRLGQVFILLTIFSGWTFAQQTPVLAPTPKPKAKIKTTPKPTPKCDDCDDETPATPPTAKTPKVPKTAPVGETVPDAASPEWDKGDKGKKVENDSDIPVEKSIEVESNVSLNLCVSEGNVRINGWDRDEVRVFVSGGSKLGFSPRVNRQTGKATSLTVLGYDPKKNKGGNLSRCLFGDEIELDVPTGARITKLEGGETTITIESVASVRVENENGNISLSGIEEGITLARTYEGDILVENSSGAITLENTSGNILAYNTEPMEDGDVLTAKTNNGSIVLQAINHSMVTARSLSGLVKFIGEIQSGGQYRFENTSGQISLEIPLESSCRIEAITQKEKFSASSDFKFTRIDKSAVPPSLQKINAQIGDGEAIIEMQNQSGTIKIRKIN